MKKNKNFFKDKGFLSTMAIILSLVVAVGIVFWAINEKGEKLLSYSEFINNCDQGHVASVVIKKDQSVSGVLRDGSIFVSKIQLTEENLSKMVKVGVNVVFDDSAVNSWFFNLIIFIITLLLGFLCYLAFIFFKGMMGSGSQGGGGSRLFSVGKSHAQFHPAGTIKTRLSDVAGISEVKAELMDIIDFLSNPEKFKEIGAKIPRGILLEGDPGNGKTLLAKAMAGEVGCAFFSTSGSDFVEIFVGVGASKVRDLFIQARKSTPCIVFIDEIDAVGRKRGASAGGGNEEREQTLNQLLSEMDGFATEPGAVIVLAATNRSDVLDKALMRPGRFDKIVNVPYPDLKAREQILQVHAKNIKLSPTIDLTRVARGTPGSTGADLANLLNEGALIAIKAGKKLVDMFDLEEARDKMLLGSENKSMVRTKDELLETAYHEAGHALLNVLLIDTDPFHKVTIIARGRTLGVSHSMPEKDTHSRNKKSLRANIMKALGGLIAERLALNTQTTGVSSDLENATKIAYNMVKYYGMSESLGAVSYSKQDCSGRVNYSQATSEKIDAEVQLIISSAYAEAELLLKDNFDKLEKLATTLVEKETLEAPEVYSLLGIAPRVYHSLVDAKVLPVVEKEKEVKEGAEAKSEDE